MDQNNVDNAAVLAILDNNCTFEGTSTTTLVYKPNLDADNRNQIVAEENENHKQNKIWTKNATVMLLSIYETKIHFLDNPKKKSKMWASIADELKALNIEVSSDQVRWKINALTKKYKDCIDNGQGSSEFKYFNEMHQILDYSNDDTGMYRISSSVSKGDGGKTKKMFPKPPFRKLRAERRAKVELDKEWIEYLKNQDEQMQRRNERIEKALLLKEEKLELRKKELEIKKNLAIKKIQLRRRKHEELLKIEKEKCELLKMILENKT